MINMKEKIIKDYINKLTINDISNFAKLKNININDTDLIILYNYVKKHYQDFLNGNDTNLVKEIKDKINPVTFKEVYKLYLEYKIKYLK